jgi:hypothetical protein
MSSGIRKMIIDDPSKFGLLTISMKEKAIEAGINTVNVMAALARKEIIKNISSDFIIRNNFTSRQVQYEKMPKGRYSLKAIHSIVGITTKASYMERQEKGGQHRPVQGKTLAIPTDVARGGSKRNTVLKNMRVSQVKRKSRRVHTNYKSKDKKSITRDSQQSSFVSRAYIAWKNNLFMPAGNKEERNLFIIKNFRRAGRDKPEFEMEQVYKFDQPVTHTQATPFFEPACEKVANDAQKIFNSQMKKLGI